MDTALTQTFARAHEQHHAVAGNPEREVGSPVEPFWGSIVIRIATAGDRRSLERLSELDCSARPTGATLIAVMHQRAVAALSLSDGKEIADPFVSTSDILELLRLRARQLNTPPRNRPPGRSLRRTTPQ
jgi:hypothetical protein